MAKNEIHVRPMILPLVDERVPATLVEIDVWTEREAPLLKEQEYEDEEGNVRKMPPKSVGVLRYWDVTHEFVAPVAQWQEVAKSIATKFGTTAIVVERSP